MTQPMPATRRQHWAQINEFSFVTGMRLLFSTCRILGRWPFRIVLYPVLLWYVVTKPEARASSSDYLRRVAAYQGGSRIKPGMFTVLRHFASFAENLLDKMLLWSGLFRTDLVKLQGKELIAAQIAAKSGGLLICCHLGNLELCRVLSKQMPGLKLTVLTHTKHAARFNRLLAQLDPESQLNLMEVTDYHPGQPCCYRQRSRKENLLRLPATAFQSRQILGLPWHGSLADGSLSSGTLYSSQSVAMSSLSNVFTADRRHFGDSFRIVP